MKPAPLVQRLHGGGLMELDQYDFINSQSKSPEDKTTSLESLISQNEDLMARLKITLRRLSILESENKKIVDENNRIMRNFNAYNDQLLIYKEKDKIWRNKLDQVDAERQQAIEKVTIIESKNNQYEAESLRFHKYHEKIKNQVKPYIQQLKEYSKSVSFENEELRQKNIDNEYLIKDLRTQIEAIIKNAQEQIEITDKKYTDMVQFYEDQMIQINHILSEYQEKEEAFRLQTLKLNAYKEKLDLLENEIVLTKRSKDDMKMLHESETSKNQQRITELSRHNQKLGIEHADLQLRVTEDQKTLTLLTNERNHFKEQLESLRFMWTSKNDENEKNKSTIEALEKLNIELSRKLSENIQTKL